MGPTGGCQEAKIKIKKEIRHTHRTPKWQKITKEPSKNTLIPKTKRGKGQSY